MKAAKRREAKSEERAAVSATADEVKVDERVHQLGDPLDARGHLEHGHFLSAGQAAPVAHLSDSQVFGLHG
jgi:hypothetical protein